MLEKHYVPSRSQRTRSVLTFFAQDTGTHNLVYANADLSKATQNREPIAFCDHWKAVSGSDPKMLIMDQKVTTQAVLGELDARGVKFATLRMRSASLMRYINGLTAKDYTTVTLDRPGPYNRPKVREDPAVTLTSYPGTVRQLIVTGLGRDAPTVIITNDGQIKTRALISQYARRMTIEQRLAEIIQAFCADALSSAVNLNVDLDVVLCVLAQALLAAFRTRLGPGYAAATPDTLQRRFLDTAGTITTDDDTITVTLNRRTYSPVLRQSDLRADTTIPGGKSAACASSSASPGGFAAWKSALTAVTAGSPRTALSATPHRMTRPRTRQTRRSGNVSAPPPWVTIARPAGTFAPPRYRSQVGRSWPHSARVACRVGPVRPRKGALR